MTSLQEHAPQVVKVSNAADFLALVPTLLGFHPHESVVIVPFTAGRSVGAMRFDLPDDTNAHSAAQVMVGLACKIPGIERVAVVVYGERASSSPVAADVASHANMCGLGVIESLYVTEAGWGYAGDPATPAPLPRAPEGIATAAPIGDQKSGAELPTIAAEQAQAVADISPVALPLGEGLIDLVEEALGQDAAAIEPHIAASVIALLNRPALRDAALVQWASNIDTGYIAFTAQMLWHNGVEIPEEIAAIMLGQGPRPDRHRLALALDLVRHLAALAPERDATGPLAAAAWLSWALGRSTHAEVYATHALRLTPGHGLSEIVATFVQSGHLPEHAFARG